MTDVRLGLDPPPLNGKYVLVGRKPVPEPDAIRWATWYESADRRVAWHVVGDVRVSTVFIGLDHSFGSGPPQFFETLVLGGEFNNFQERYATWTEAEAGHAVVLKWVKEGIA